MIIEIGSKPLKEISAEDIKEIIIIEGCCCSLEYWNEPLITDFKNKLFSDTVVLHYHSLRKDDNRKSAGFIFFFDFLALSFHYTRDYERNKNQQPNGRRIGLKTLRFLIAQGYDVPLYDKTHS